MRAVARAVGLFASLTFMQAMAGSAIATTGVEESVPRTDDQVQSEEVESLEFTHLSLMQRMLLAAATAFDPEAVEDAIVWYFYPVSLLLDEGEGHDADWRMIGVRLRNGQYRIFHRDALSDMTTGLESDAGRVIASLDNERSLVLRAGQRLESDAGRVIASLDNERSLVLLGGSPESSQDILIGQVWPQRVDTQSGVSPQAIIRWGSPNIGSDWASWSVNSQ